MRVTVLDYGVGNLHSLTKAIAVAGGTPVVVTDAARAVDAEALVLPGVGAFPAAAERLARARDALADAVRDGLPTLGICLGMQLLFDESDEGPGAGLSVFAGRVERLSAECVPQIGWNTLEESRDSLVDRARLRAAYYANSFVCRPRDESIVTVWSRHEGDRFPAVVRRGRTVGVQFHPEKSSAPGLAFLRGFLDQAAA
jgi:glutamine amidotransferase